MSLRAIARVALTLILILVGAGVGACMAVLGVDDVGYAGGDATVDDDVVDAGTADGEEGGGSCKTCVVCVDAADPLVGCANDASCYPCQGPANGVAVCDPAGQCSVGCTPPFLDCNGDAADGCEVDPTSGDPSNCGTCGQHCTSGRVCDRDACTASCTPPEINCDGGCSDIDASVNNCGRCANRCPGGANASPVCVAGKCGLKCSSGFQHCSSNPLDGCEVPPRDLQHCGDCTTACPPRGNAIAVCSGTPPKCGFSCRPSYVDCNLNPDDGCECNILNQNCETQTCQACVQPGTACANVKECCNAGNPAAVSCMPHGALVAPVCCLNSGFPCKGSSAACCSGKCLSTGCQ